LKPILTNFSLDENFNDYRLEKLNNQLIDIEELFIYIEKFDFTSSEYKNNIQHKFNAINEKVINIIVLFNMPGFVKQSAELFLKLLPIHSNIAVDLRFVIENKFIQFINFIDSKFICNAKKLENIKSFFNKNNYALSELDAINELNKIFSTDKQYFTSKYIQPLFIWYSSVYKYSLFNLGLHKNMFQLKTTTDVYKSLKQKLIKDETGDNSYINFEKSPNICTRILYGIERLFNKIDKFKPMFTEYGIPYTPYISAITNYTNLSTSYLKSRIDL